MSARLDIAWRGGWVLCLGGEETLELRSLLRPRRRKEFVDID